MKLATDVFAVVIALAGFAVSYTTQALLAGHHGFLSWEAWLWPGIADAAALAMILRLHFGLVRPGWYTIEAWSVFGLAAAIMVVANTLADLRDPLSGAMHGAVPVMAMATWHVIIHGRPAAGRADTTNKSIIVTQHESTRSALPPTRVPARAAVRRLLRRQGSELTPERVAARTGVSKRHAARLLREERQPHVVEGQQ